MQDDHPVIAFLTARETDGRMCQISDRSYVKHGFFALSSSQCTPCQNPSNGDYLGVGCSDTYGTGNNGDPFWLGPPDEMDPWLGTWDPMCSHFDMGQPPQSPPFDCDGNRSTISAGTMGHRVKMYDADLNVSNSDYYYQAMYLVRGEPGDSRKNNLGSKEFIPNWTGSQWSISVPGGQSIAYGSILENWNGATVASVANGQNDGGVHLAVRTEDLGNGFWRYEYAVHNQDNGRGIEQFCLPVCPGATIQNVGFHDPDTDAGNDWTFSQSATECVFETPDNPILWNSFYNFYFECDAIPSKPHSAMLTMTGSGPGMDVMPVGTTVPMGPLTSSNLGFSTTASNGLQPELRSCGDLDTGGTGHFTLRLAPAGTTAFLVAGFSGSPTPFADGTLIPIPIAAVIPIGTGPEGIISFSIAGGGGPIDVYMQYVILDAVAGGFSFSNAIRASFGA
jgi:hypothetical protein